MRNRRSFLGALTAAALAAPALGVRAQPPLKRVVIVSSASAVIDALAEGLRERGWVHGRNMAFESIGAQAGESGPKELEAGLARKPEVLVLAGALRIADGVKLAKGIALVGVDLESDPVATGIAKSLARPGGNITGVWLDLPELAGKNVQILRELVPGLAALGVVWDERVGPAQFNALQAAAKNAKLALHNGVVRSGDEVDAAIERIVREGAKALMTLTAPSIFMARERIVEAAAKHKVPVASLFTAFPAVGGLVAYGPSLPGMFRQAAGHVDRILRGAKPGDIPIERPVKFELVLNAMTAKKLGIVIPESVRIRADRVIDA